MSATPYTGRPQVNLEIRQEWVEAGTPGRSELIPAATSASAVLHVPEDEALWWIEMLGQVVEVLDHWGRVWDAHVLSVGDYSGHALPSGRLTAKVVLVMSGGPR